MHDSLKRLQQLSESRFNILLTLAIFFTRIILDSAHQALSNVGPLSNADFAHDSLKRLQRRMALHLPVKASKSMTPLVTLIKSCGGLSNPKKYFFL